MLLKKIRYSNVCLLVVLSSCVYGQSSDFSAYDRITNSNFAEFVSMFPEKQLPVNTQEFVSSSLSTLEGTNIPDNLVNEFLKINDNYLVPRLYTLTIESGETNDQYGDFKPVYRLPTNGDYIILLVYQFDVRSEWTQRINVLCYDLSGSFIGKTGSGFIFDGGANYVECTISEQLEFKYTYLSEIGDNRSSYFSCKPCSKPYHTDTYKISNTGENSLVSTLDHGVGTFNYVPFFFELQDYD